MVNADLDATFHALSDPTRREILARLRDGEATVTELARPFDISLNAVSKHLRVLEEAGLVRRRVEGRTHWIGIDPEPFDDILDWADEYRAFWGERLDALDSFMRERRARRKAKK